KGLRLFGEGVGAELARQVALKQDTRAISDMLAQGVALGWAMTQETINANIGSIISQFDACRSFLRQNKAGYGIERCLYNLNPEAPCMSEMLRNYYVLTPEAMLDAFEDICQKSNDPPAF